jgi:hypothetical protein
MTNHASRDSQGKSFGSLIGALTLLSLVAVEPAQTGVLLAVRGSGDTAQLPPSPAALGRVSGRVTAATDGRALRSAQVEILGLSLPERKVTRSDEAGHFDFRDLPQGRYALRAQADGFGQSVRTRDPRRGGWRVIDVAANGAVDTVDLALLRLGSVSGKLTDRRGEPAVGVSVMALVMERFAGIDHLTQATVAVARSDDQGRYKLTGLAEERYFILACPPSFDGQPPANDARTGYAPTFYGDSQWPAGAITIASELEQEVSDTNIMIEPLQTFVLSGVARSTDNTPLRAAPLRLLPGVGATIPVVQQTQTSESGEFEFTSLVPGEYTLETAPTNQELETFGLQVIAVNGDTKHVVLTTTPARFFRGQVQPAPGSRFPSANDVQIVASPVDFARSPVGLGARVQLQDDFSMRIGPVWGPHLLQVLGLPSGWVLDNVEVNGEDHTDTPIDFDALDPKSTIVRVTLSADSSSITGRAIDDKGDGVAYADVFLRADNRLHGGVLKKTTTTFDGAFEFDELAAGHYRIVAFSDGRAGSGSAALDTSLSEAKVISLGHRDRQSALVRLASR